LAQQTGIRRPRQIGRPLADLIAAADVVMAWPEIVGERLAGVCEPVSLEWPRAAKARETSAFASETGPGPHGKQASKQGVGAGGRSQRPGQGASEDKTAASLVVRVEGAFGLEVQHLAPVILERVNAYFGWRCADKLVIRQGRIARKAETRPRASPPDPEALARGRKIAAGIGDETLRESLSQLGALVLSKR
jgi:hypothetical protein